MLLCRCLSQLLTSDQSLPSHAELRSTLQCLSGTEETATLLDCIVSALDEELPKAPDGRHAQSLQMSPASALRCIGEWPRPHLHNVGIQCTLVVTTRSEMLPI